MKTQLKDLSVKLQTSVQPVFMSRKIAQEFPTSEPKPQLIDQQCVVYNFKCDQCDAGYVGYTRGHLFVRVDGHRSKTLSVQKHYDNTHAGRIPDDLCNCFSVLKKCHKFDCLINEMLLIKQSRPCLNVQSDSVRAKVPVQPMQISNSELPVTLEIAYLTSFPRQWRQDVAKMSDLSIVSFCLYIITKVLMFNTIKCPRLHIPH